MFAAWNLCLKNVMFSFMKMLKVLCSYKGDVLVKMSQETLLESTKKLERKMDWKRQNLKLVWNVGLGQRYEQQLMFYFF